MFKFQTTKNKTEFCLFNQKMNLEQKILHIKLLKTYLFVAHLSFLLFHGPWNFVCSCQFFFFGCQLRCEQKKLGCGRIIKVIL